MSKFEINIDKSSADFKVKITGTIDEDVDFNAHALAGASSVTLLLGAIKSINSCGIREWIKWLGSAGSATVTYVECPKIIVDQINMVQGFLPAGGKIQSFYVPYYNDDSGEEKNILFALGKEFTESSLTPPGEVLDSSGKPMEMDVVESKYFKFIKK
jgi:hypothetical protein